MDVKIGMVPGLGFAPGYEDAVRRGHVASADHRDVISPGLPLQQTGFGKPATSIFANRPMEFVARNVVSGLKRKGTAVVVADVPSTLSFTSLFVLLDVRTGTQVARRILAIALSKMPLPPTNGGRIQIEDGATLRKQARKGSFRSVDFDLMSNGWIRPHGSEDYLDLH